MLEIWSRGRGRKVQRKKMRVDILAGRPGRLQEEPEVVGTLQPAPLVQTLERLAWVRAREAGGGPCSRAIAGKDSSSAEPAPAPAQRLPPALETCWFLPLP